MYYKGMETKQSIYEVAKKLFYEFGYQKTTIRLIAKEANIPMGLIPYHFKNKDNIVQKIYTDYINEIFKLIDFETKDNIKSYLLRQVIGLRIYYNNILVNENNSKFHHELTLKQSNYNILFDNVEKGYKEMLDEFNIFIPRQEYIGYITAEFGARQELLLRYYSGDLNCSIQELVDVIACIAPRLFQVEHNIVNSILFNSHSIFKGLDETKVNEVKFLI
ncbi:MAG: TetR/AcrR family transcriptional regulator [Eubacteriales bacterium]